MNLGLFFDILNTVSTSGQERLLAEKMEEWLSGSGPKITRVPEPSTADAPFNILIAWGDPQILFCTHLDTVPPYIPPKMTQLSCCDALIEGRGSCDAKGQIFSMLTACQELAERGESGFGLLLLHGEETGSYGAKEFRNLPGAKYVIVGEPTDNKMVTASKGTKAFEVEITGKPFHSGYPEHGLSAINLFVDLVNKLRATEFPVDPEMGETTWNIGKLISDNPQNILSPKLTCRIYFRTTEASDKAVVDTMLGMADEHISIKNLGGDTPMHYTVLPGFPTTTVAFGSDAPQLTNCEHKLLIGPGSILVAHTAQENIRLSQLQKAVENYISIFEILKTRI